MNSAELPTSSNLISEQPPWGDVRRIFRRICTLRASGKDDEAAALERSEFHEALVAARKVPGAAQKETTILAEESERVASASALAEVLAPLLAAKLQLQSAPASLAAESPVAMRKSDVALSPPPRRPRVGTSDAPESAPGVPGIADLIDGMLSQESAPLPARRGA